MSLEYFTDFIKQFGFAAIICMHVRACDSVCASLSNYAFIMCIFR